MVRGPLALLRWTCLSLLLFVHAAHCFYLPGVAPQDFKMFFKQFLAFFGIHQMALCLFRFIAALGRTEVVGNTLGGVVVAISFWVSVPVAFVSIVMVQACLFQDFVPMDVQQLLTLEHLCWLVRRVRCCRRTRSSLHKSSLNDWLCS